MSVQQGIADYSDSHEWDLFLEEAWIKFEKEEQDLDSAYQEFTTEKRISELFRSRNINVRDKLLKLGEGSEIYHIGNQKFSTNHPLNTQILISRFLPQMKEKPFVAVLIGVQFYGHNNFVEPVKRIFQKVIETEGKLYFLDKDLETLEKLKEKTLEGYSAEYAQLVEIRVVDLSRDFFSKSLSLLEQCKKEEKSFQEFIDAALSLAKTECVKPLAVKNLPKADFVSSSLVSSQIFDTWFGFVSETYQDVLKDAMALELDQETGVKVLLIARILEVTHAEDLVNMSKKWIYVAHDSPIEREGMDETTLVQSSGTRSLMVYKYIMQIFKSHCSEPLAQQKWIYVTPGIKYLVTALMLEKVK
jgi:hypothetical protein